jgi:muramidase (phage lysozyme)
MKKVTKTDKRVQKFRSIEDMNEAPVLRRGDFESFLRHCARWWAISPKRYPRGVFKFRTIEEAQEARRKHSGLD